MRPHLAALAFLFTLSLTACAGPLDLTGAGAPPATRTATPARTRAPTRAATPARATPTPRPTAALSGGRILIPRIGVDAPLTTVGWTLVDVEGQTVGQWQAPPVGAAAHLSGTAGPHVLGGNCVITGHSAAVRGGVFGRLSELVPGDELHLLDAAGVTYPYVVERVDKLQEVGAPLAARRANAQAALAAPADDTSRLTLITCWPDWAYTHRLVVVARPQAAP
ncbi:MAG: sortase [Anaerolineae bacterium]